MSLPLADKAIRAGRPIRRRGRLASAGRSLALSVALAACGGAAPDAPGNPGTGGPVGPGAPTLRPVDGSLGGLLPTEVDGEALTAENAEGEAILDLLPNADGDELREQLESLRLGVEDISVAVAGDLEGANDSGGVGILAVRVPGVLFTPGSGPQTRLVSSLLGIAPNARTGYATMARRTTTTIIDPADPEKTTYVYGPTEVIFVVRGPEATAEEVFGKLPQRP